MDLSPKEINISVYDSFPYKIRKFIKGCLWRTRYDKVGVVSKFCNMVRLSAVIIQFWSTCIPQVVHIWYLSASAKGPEWKKVKFDDIPTSASSRRSFEFNPIQTNEIRIELCVLKPDSNQNYHIGIESIDFLGNDPKIESVVKRRVHWNSSTGNRWLGFPRIFCYPPTGVVLPLLYENSDRSPWRQICFKPS